MLIVSIMVTINIITLTLMSQSRVFIHQDKMSFMSSKPVFGICDKMSFLPTIRSDHLIFLAGVVRYYFWGKIRTDRASQ